MHKILERGFYVRAMAWRKPGGEKIVKIDDMDSLNMPDKMISYPLNLLGEVILEELMGLDNVSIHWNHRVIGLSQDENRVSVEVEYLGHQCTIVADFVVGCDGASSGVRKALLGRDFSGYTLDTQMVTTNVCELLLHIMVARISMSLTVLVYRFITTSIDTAGRTFNGRSILNTGLSQ